MNTFITRNGSALFDFTKYVEQVKHKDQIHEHRKVNYTSFTLLDSLLKRDLEFEMRAFLAPLGLGFERVISDLDFGFE